MNLEGSSDTWDAAHPLHSLVAAVSAEGLTLKWTFGRPKDRSERVDGRFFIMESNSEHLQAIAEMTEVDKVKPAVDSVFKLADCEVAFARIDNG